MKNKRQDVMKLMNKINRKLFLVNSENSDLLIGMGQINILKEIINNEKITQDELANILNLDKTTIAKAVKRLEAHHLITRNRSSTDLRKKELVATKKAYTIKEYMTKHLEEESNILFDNITEEELNIFKNVLEKIELNIERKRKMMKDKKQLGMKIVKFIDKNEGITITELAKQLDKKIEEIEKVVEKLTAKELIENNDGVLNVTKKAKDLRGRDEHMNKNHRMGKGGHKEHGQIFKLILKNNGLSKDELVEKSGKSVSEIDLLIKHFESKGVVEIKEGKLFANKEALKKHHKH